MFRPVFFLCLVYTLFLTACGGIRFLPYGEEVLTGTNTDSSLIQMTPTGGSQPTARATATAQPAVVTTAAGAVVTTAAVPTVTAVATEIREPVPLAIEERKPYQLQPGSPAWLPNFIHPEAGCNWMGVVGQAFDLAGNPITPLVVEVGGVLEGTPVQLLSLTGVAPTLGPSGYEIVLGDEAIETSSALWIQLKDLSGLPLTDPIYFTTFSDCDRNLVLINFIESSFEIEVKEYFVPVFYNGFSDLSSGSLEPGEIGGENGFSTFYFPVFFNGFQPEP